MKKDISEIRVAYRVYAAMSLCCDACSREWRTEYCIIPRDEHQSFIYPIPIAFRPSCLVFSFPPSSTFDLVIRRHERQTGLCTTSAVSAANDRTPPTHDRYAFERRGQCYVCQRERKGAIDLRLLRSKTGYRSRHCFVRRTYARSRPWNECGCQEAELRGDFEASDGPDVDHTISDDSAAW